MTGRVSDTIYITKLFQALQKITTTRWIRQYTNEQYTKTYFKNLAWRANKGQDLEV